MGYGSRTQSEFAEILLHRVTVPARSNLTGNALLERKWNAKWNAAGTPKERQNFCGVGARSEQERVLLRTYGSRRDCDVTAC